VSTEPERPDTHPDDCAGERRIVVARALVPARGTGASLPLRRVPFCSSGRMSLPAECPRGGPYGHRRCRAQPGRAWRSVPSCQMSTVWPLDTDPVTSGHGVDRCHQVTVGRRQEGETRVRYGPCGGHLTCLGPAGGQTRAGGRGYGPGARQGQGRGWPGTRNGMRPRRSGEHAASLDRRPMARSRRQRSDLRQAIASISTSPALGSAATWTVERAGGGSGMNLP
jgi:hypothetical protein